MDLVDLVRIAFRRWFIAVPATLLALTAAIGVRSSVEVSYESRGSLLLFAPTTHDVSKNRLLSFNSLTIPANVVSEVVNGAETREKLVAQGASRDYSVGLDPTSSSPLVIAVSSGTLAQEPRTVELVLNEVAAELQRRQEALGAPPDTWITTQIITPPSEPVMVTGARTRAFLAALFLGFALAGGLTLLGDLVLNRRKRSRTLDLEPEARRDFVDDARGRDVPVVTPQSLYPGPRAALPEGRPVAEQSPVTGPVVGRPAPPAPHSAPPRQPAPDENPAEPAVAGPKSFDPSRQESTPPEPARMRHHAAPAAAEPPDPEPTDPAPPYSEPAETLPVSRGPWAMRPTFGKPALSEAAHGESADVPVTPDPSAVSPGPPARPIRLRPHPFATHDPTDETTEADVQRDKSTG